MRYSTNSNFKDKDDNNVMNNYNVMYTTVPVMITEISCQDSEVYLLITGIPSYNCNKLKCIQNSVTLIYSYPFVSVIS
jgi:hypothetical protein